MKPTFRPGTRRNRGSIQAEHVEVFRPTDEVADEVFAKFNRYAPGQKLEPVARSENHYAEPVVSNLAHELIRRQAMPAERLHELKEIIMYAGADSVVWVVLGGQITLDWIKSAKPEPPPRPREPVTAPQPAA